MSDKIIQAINEIELETADELRCHIDPDIKEKMANHIATFLMKGVGNLNPVYDLLAQAHSDGKYPMDSPKGRGDFLRDYANRMAVMFSAKGGALIRDEGGKKMLNLATPPLEAINHKNLGEQFTEPVPPKASEKEPL